MLDESFVAQIEKALREPPDELLTAFNLAQQQAPDIGGDVPAIETGAQGFPVEGLKAELVPATVCSHFLAFLSRHKSFLAKQLYRSERPFSRPRVRNPG